MKKHMIPAMAFAAALSFSACEKSPETSPDLMLGELESQSASRKVLAIGMEYQGGIIFKLDESGQHGLIASKDDVGPAPWGCYGSYFPEVSAAVDGKTASRLLLSACKEPGTAVRLCAKYEVRDKRNPNRVYKDWYMAGIAELTQIVRAVGRNGNMCGRSYWSFQQVNGFQAMPKDPAQYAMQYNVSCSVPPNSFSFGFFNYPLAKTALVYARPIRSF